MDDLHLLAVDPGSERSAFVDYNAGLPARFGMVTNEEMVEVIASSTADVLAVEMIASYGMPVGAEVFATCLWVGRYVQAWSPREHRLVYRREVKLHLCGSMRAKDPNVRAALIDRYGPGKEKAIGLKASPGPLYGIRADVWAALAVAVTATETAAA